MHRKRRYTVDADRAGHGFRMAWAKIDFPGKTSYTGKEFLPEEWTNEQGNTEIAGENKENC